MKITKEPQFLMAELSPETITAIQITAREAIELALKELKIKTPNRKKEESLHRLSTLHGIGKREIIRAIEGGMIDGRLDDNGRWKINVNSFAKYFLS